MMPGGFVADHARSDIADRAEQRDPRTELHVAGLVELLTRERGRFAPAARSEALEQRMLQGFAALNTRFDDMRDLWRAELHRVEGILDARLKQLEERSR